MAEYLRFVKYFLRGDCAKLLDLGGEYYLQLVRVLYANFRTVKMGATISLECQVKHTKFALTELDLNHILGLPTITQTLYPRSRLETDV